MKQQAELIPAGGEVAQQNGSIQPHRLMELAVQSGNIEAIERMMALQERHEANEARKAYHAAMTAFKAKPPKILKDKLVNAGPMKYRHATLANVTETISAALSAHGLTASWITDQRDGQVCVTCKITHELGHSEQTTLTSPPDDSGRKNPVQQIGSTVSYLQRYTLLALTGLATHEQDDDWKAPEPVSFEQSAVLLEMLEALQEDRREKAAAWMRKKGWEGPSDVPAALYREVYAMLERASK